MKQKRCNTIARPSGEQCLLSVGHEGDCEFASETIEEVRRVGANAVIRKRTYEPPKMTEHGSIDGVTLGTARPTVGICK